MWILSFHKGEDTNRFEDTQFTSKKIYFLCLVINLDLLFSPMFCFSIKMLIYYTFALSRPYSIEYLSHEG
jgi:hypothetical protein